MSRKSHAAKAKSPGTRRAQPSGPDPLSLKALAELFNQGRHAEAEASARALAAAHPADGFSWKVLGTVLLILGRPAEAAEASARAAALLPHDAQVHANLAIALQSLGDLPKAEASYRRALALNPNFADAHSNLGNTLHALKRTDEAEACFRRAMELAPGNAHIHANLGAALNALGRPQEAEASCRRALELNPNAAQAHNALGMALNAQNRPAEAESCFRQALALRPGYAEALNNLGNALHHLGRLLESEQSFRNSLAIRPADAETLSNLGNTLHTLGRLREAESCYREALAIRPDLTAARSNLLFVLSHAEHCGPAEYLEEARRYGREAAQRAGAPYAAWRCETKPRRLRVGFVSGDLRSHPVGHFLEAVLEQLDPERVELLAYPTANDGDALTERIRPCFAAWKSLAGLRDEAAAELIHADGPHVLVDLSGHTAQNRLELFARKPAPVQVSWLGYFASTGLAEIDFLLADETGVPEGHRQWFTETIVPLPETRLCFTAPKDDIAVGPLPALKNGGVTFGSFQNLAKIGEPVLDLWAEVLVALPGSQLRLQCRQLDDSAVGETLRASLARRGVKSDRVRLLTGVPRNEYLTAHNEVDIILDTFPYPGGTTTCEALWMGVPTLTLAGKGLLGRQGASLLTAAGLSDWIAWSGQEYRDKAVALASDLPGLAALRQDLRKRALASALFDAPRFARRLETALWDMWERRPLR